MTGEPMQSAKMNGTQRKMLASPSHVLRHAKGTPQAEATLSSKKIKHVPLAIVELHLHQSVIPVSQSVSRKF